MCLILEIGVIIFKFPYLENVFIVKSRDLRVWFWKLFLARARFDFFVNLKILMR